VLGHGRERALLGYVWVNGKHKSLTLDMKKTRRARISKRLAARADVVLGKFAPRRTAGLGAKDLTAANHAESMLRSRATARTTLSRHKAYDGIPGRGGDLATTGYPDAPAKVGVSMIDLTSSMYAAVGILLALYQREKTGQASNRHFHVRRPRFPGSAISRIIIGIAAK